MELKIKGRLSHFERAYFIGDINNIDLKIDKPSADGRELVEVLEPFRGKNVTIIITDDTVEM